MNPPLRRLKKHQFVLCPGPVRTGSSPSVFNSGETCAVVILPNALDGHRNVAHAVEAYPCRSFWRLESCTRSRLVSWYMPAEQRKCLADNPVPNIINLGIGKIVVGVITNKQPHAQHAAGSPTLQIQAPGRMVRVVASYRQQGVVFAGRQTRAEMQHESSRTARRNRLPNIAGGGVAQSVALGQRRVQH